MKVECELKTYTGQGLNLTRSKDTILVKDVDDRTLVELIIFDNDKPIKAFTVNGDELISAINKCQLDFGK